MSSRRRQVLEAVRTRLNAIVQSSGFATDAGNLVLLGEATELGPDDPAVALAIVVNDDQLASQGKALLITLPVQIAALAKADLDEPWAAIEDVIGDIKKAMEMDDRQLGGLASSNIARGATRTLPRESGSTTVGASIEYLIPYKEAWGAP